MQIRSFAALPLVLTLALATCRREAAQAPHAPRVEILKDVPPAIQSTLRDTTGTADAEQRTYSSALPLDTTAGFYRTWLPRLGWQLMSDRADPPAGRIDLYAHKGNRTLWVHLEKQSEGTTRYTLIAAVDTSAARNAPPRSDSTP